jgi:hypothetical protein
MLWLQQNSMKPVATAAEGGITCGNGALFMALILVAMIGLTILTQTLYLLFHWAFAKKE